MPPRKDNDLTVPQMEQAWDALEDKVRLCIREEIAPLNDRVGGVEGRQTKVLGIYGVAVALVLAAWAVGGEWIKKKIGL